MSISPDEITISIKKEIDGKERDISLLITYDNRKGFVRNVWVTELLLDGNPVDVLAHSYAEEIAEPTTDSTAITRSHNDIIHSNDTARDLTQFLIHATNLQEVEASGIINELVEICKSRDKEVYKVCPQVRSEIERSEALEIEQATSGILPYKSSKPIKMSPKLKYDKKTGQTFNTETMKYHDVKTGMDSDKDYIPESEPGAESINDGISVVKSGGGDTRYTYPLISITKEIDGVVKEIGVKIIFEKRVFGTSFWYTEFLVDGEVTDESMSEEAFVVSKKAQTGIEKFIINALELEQLQSNEITKELISIAKQHENEILSMLKIEPESEFAGLEGDDRLKAILKKEYYKTGNRDSDIKYAKMFVGNLLCNKSEEEAFKFIDFHLKEHFDFNDKDIREVKSYCSETIKAHSFLHEKDTDEDSKKESEPEPTKTDEKRIKIREDVMTSKLPSDIAKELQKLGTRYNQSYAEVEKQFYNVACDSKFDSCKDVNERFAQALEPFKVVFSQKYRKQELVTFDDDFGAQTIYDMIDHVVILERTLSNDETIWELYINDKSMGIVDHKISLTAKQMQSFNGFKTVFFNTFHIPAPKVKAKNWDQILFKLNKNKAEIIESPEDSDLMDEAKSILEDICKMPITTTEGEHAAAGKKIFEQNDIYYVTTPRIKEIWESQKCKFSRGKIGQALVEMGIKYPGYNTKHLGNTKPRCWWFHKDAFENFKEGKYNKGE